MMRNLIFWIGIYFLCHVAFFSIIFSYSRIAGGDYITYRPEHVKLFKHEAFSVWDGRLNFGFNALGLMHYAPYNYLSGYIGEIVHYDMVIWERFMWWVPFFLLSFFSSSFLFRTLFPRNPFWIFSPFIFVFNTYVLLILAGGQVAGIGLAYAIAPLVVGGFIRIITRSDLLPGKSESYVKKIIEAQVVGLFFSLQIVFDLRIAYITLVGVVLYIAYTVYLTLMQKKWNELHHLLLYSALPFCVSFLLHAYWLLPTFLYKQNPIDQFGRGFTSTDAVSFFSFAKLEHTFSLLHPNWPENIFGKVGFMKWEFILLPIIVFSSLLFINKKNNERASLGVKFLALLGLISIFLGKGVNDPLGEIYVWMFHHVPGFIMFRDSTKWYSLIALSYSMLIPFTLWNLYQMFVSYKQQLSTYLFGINKILARIYALPSIFLVYYIVILLYPSWSQNIHGTFKQRNYPSDYQKLQVYLTSQEQFSRTLWIPSTQRFALPSDIHPVITGYEYFPSSSISAMMSLFQNPDLEEQLRESAIRYVIVPYDSEKEIFITDRMYDSTIFPQIVTSLRKIPWLIEIPSIGGIRIFELKDPMSHFWSSSVSGIINNKLSPTSYEVRIPSSTAKDTIIFSEKYDVGWKATINGKTIGSINYNNFNKFALPDGKNYSMFVTYIPQTWLTVSLWISSISLMCIVTMIVLYVLKYRLAFFRLFFSSTRT